MAAEKVLIIDDEENMRHLLSVILGKEGYKINQAKDGEDALSKIDQEDFDFILSDIRMPKMNGMQLLDELKKRKSDALCIVMSAYGNTETAIEVMKHGAYDYISKPFKPDEVVLTLRKAAERQMLYRENRALRSQNKKKYGLDSIIAKSSIMNDIFRSIEKISEYKSTILIMGE